MTKTKVYPNGSFCLYHDGAFAYDEAGHQWQVVLDFYRLHLDHDDLQFKLSVARKVRRAGGSVQDVEDHDYAIFAFADSQAKVNKIIALGKRMGAPVSVQRGMFVDYKHCRCDEEQWAVELEVCSEV